MKLILLMCSSGVAGLYTYMFLTYLSIFDTEREEIKKILPIFFSFISVSIVFAIYSFIKLIVKIEILSIFIALIISIPIIKFFNEVGYSILIKKFRKKANDVRKKLNLNDISHFHAIDEVLYNRDYYYYIEKIDDQTNIIIWNGFLSKHELNRNDESIFIIQPFNINKELDIVKNSIVRIYETNKNFHYKFYKIKKSSIIDEN